jgi:lipid-A-disaccharide synthase
MSGKLLIIAGEASGDLHGAALVKALNELVPGIELFGVGGDRMIAEGFEPLFHIKEMAFLGFGEVVQHLPYILKVQKRLLDEAKIRNVNTVVLIDYPGFNLNIAKKFKKLGLKVIYYIAPQVWAWGQGRIKKLKARTDIILSVFPFEEKFFKEKGLNVEFVGNPLAERISNYQFTPEGEFRKMWGLDEKKEILAILPGSREHEVELLLKPALDGGRKLAKEFDFQIVVGCADNIDESLLKKIDEGNDFKLVKGYQFELKKYAKFGIVKSGTSTMESALLDLPLVVIYKTSGLTYQIGKRLIKISNLGMVNIIAEETIAPELIQDEVTAENIYSTVKKVLNSPDLLKKQKAGFERIKKNLGKHKASSKAATIILDEAKR